MSRLVLVLASAFALTSCASDSRPLSPRFDPSNPDAPESAPIVASNTLSPTGTSRTSSAAHENHDAGDAGTHQVFTCPMHPEVRSDKPGRCPRCGMNLVPAVPGASDAGTADEHQHHGGTP